MGFFDKAVSSAKSAMKTADEKLGNFVDGEKIDSKIRDEERNIEKFTAEIGKSVVDSLKAGDSVDMEAINVLMQKIRDSEALIEKFKADKESLKESEPKKDEETEEPKPAEE